MILTQSSIIPAQIVLGLLRFARRLGCWEIPLFLSLRRGYGTLGLKLDGPALHP